MYSSHLSHPSHPCHPGHPSYPSHPCHPSHPSHPSHLSHPCHPSRPRHPNHLSHPGYTVNPPPPPITVKEIYVIFIWFWAVTIFMIRGLCCEKGGLIELLYPVSRRLRIWPRLFKRWIALSTWLITIQRISIREINRTIHWIEVYPMDSGIQPLNNRGLVFKNLSG